MVGILVFAILGTLGGGDARPWDAAMCFTGRNQWNYQPRHYFSECSQESIDYEAYCAPFNVKFSLKTTSKPTEAGCRDVVQQNYPNLWRFRGRRVLPIICDENIEGPTPPECRADR